MEGYNRVRRINSTAYLLIEEPRKIKSILSIKVKQLAQMDIDWVKLIAVPVFEMIKAEYAVSFDSFLSLSTRSGMDVISAAEILGVTRLGFTDMDERALQIAVENIESSLLQPEDYTLEYGTKEQLQRDVVDGRRYDIVYLPNFCDDKDMSIERRIREAVDFMNSRGFMVLSISGVEINAAIRMAEQSGLNTEILAYLWREIENPEFLERYMEQKQSEADPVIFYNSRDLKDAYEWIAPIITGTQAYNIENNLREKRLSTVDAYQFRKNGESIGHTVVVLKCWFDNK